MKDVDAAADILETDVMGNSPMPPTDWVNADTGARAFAVGHARRPALCAGHAAAGLACPCPSATVVSIASINSNPNWIARSTEAPSITAATSVC